MTKKIITKAQLIEVLNQWGQQQINSEKLQLWMLDNFEPDEFVIGAGEQECVVEAMLIVMNEYELAEQNKCRSEQFQLAIDFVNCNEASFINRKTAFLRDSFSD